MDQVSRMMDQDDTLAPYLWTKPEHEGEAEALLPTGAPVLAIAPMANWPGKIWPAERYQEILRRLTSQQGLLPGARVATFSSPAERQDAMRIVADVPEERRIDLAGRITLLTAYACLKRCDFFVGNDSALMHMAAASGTPTVGLFGPSKDEHYGPWGEMTAVARTNLSFDEIITSPGYDKSKNQSWMSTLSVNATMEVIAGLLDRASQAAAK